jgi:hypothetical protein
MLALRTPNLCPFGWDFRLIQSELGQAGGTGDDHGVSSLGSSVRIMMKGLGKIKKKIEGEAIPDPYR